MPFAKTAVEPTRLSRGRLGAEYKFDLDIVTNNTVCGLLRQLSSLANQADTIFAEISDECVQVIQRTQRIRGRIGEITKHVDKLNAKAVTVPVGDLTTFSNQTEHHQAEHGFDCCLFSPSSRPDTVADLYDACAPNPLATIRRCNLLRSDGKTGSKYFSPAIVINDEKYEQDNVDLSHLSFRKPPVVQFRKSVQIVQIERETKELKRPRTNERPHSVSVLTELDLTVNSSFCSTLPTPEQKLREISRSQPVTLVPIDVSGNSFNRMCDYRSSIRSIKTQYEVLEEGSRAAVTASGSTARRKRHRRQTLSGLPGFVFAEISTPETFKVGNLRTRSVSRERWERPRSMAMEGTGLMSGRRARSRERRAHRNRTTTAENGEERSDSPVSKSCSLRRSFRSLFRGSRSRSQDLWAEGRPRSPGPPMIDLNVPLRRSRSLPRSLKTVMRDSASVVAPPLEANGRSASTEGRLDGWTEEELTERDIPWVRGKPPQAPGSAVKTPSSKAAVRIPRSRSQSAMAAARRRNSQILTTVDSSDDSSTAAGPTSALTPLSSRNTASGRSVAVRPYGLRSALSQGQLRVPIPASVPTTPVSMESLIVRSPSGGSSSSSSAPIAASRGTMNIPAGGAAWEPFASVRLRQRNTESGRRNGVHTPDDRQSSSGNWSASSSSARQSLESDYNRLLLNSPGKHSQTSLDKDSALSLNIHSSSEDRYTTDNNGDMGEETSTLTGDTSTINGETATEDTSTVNGDADSVIDVKANFTKMNTEDWLKSLTREKRSRRKSKRDSLDGSSGLTQQMLRAHDHAHKPFVRSLSRLPDEESSVYSVDQEGFYTSMHRDSGLKRSQSEMIQEETQWQLSMDSFMSSSNSTIASTLPPSKPKKAEKARRRSTSFLSSLPGLKKIKSSSKSKNNKKTPPPPPRRETTVLDKSNLTLHLEEPDMGSPPTPSSELSKSADTSTETVINTGLQTTSPNGKNGHNDSSCESDAEAIYARLKNKTSISAAGIPSLCSVTPICSDEEDADMLSFSRSWRHGHPSGNGHDTSTWSGSLISTKSAPGSLIDGVMVTSTPLHSAGVKSKGDQSSEKQAVDLSISDTLMQVADSSGDSSGFSTWPRSPASKGDRRNEQKAPRPPRTLEFSPSGFDPRDSRNIIPEAKTPEENQKGRTLTTRNSFRGSHEGSVGGSEKDACSSKGTSSIYSPSNSSIPSSLSDEMPAMHPGKFMTVRSDVRRASGKRGLHVDGASLSGGSGGSACTSPTNKSGHVYANVVVQDNGPLSASSSASSLSFGGSNAVLPTSSVSSVSDQNNDYMSITSTWPRRAKSASNSDTASDAGKSEKKRFSTFAKPEKEEDKKSAGKDKIQEEPLSLPVTSYNGPVPAHAKLIISSPVATKVSFKENPYKRSVCSPVTTSELMSFWNQNVKDKPYNHTSSALDGSDLSSQEPLPSAFKPVLPAPAGSSSSRAISRPLFPTLDSMKHSISFPVEKKQEEKPEPPASILASATPSSYGRSWYDGVATQKSPSKNSEVVPITTASTVPKTMSSLPSQISLTSFISDSPTPSLLDQRRDSISSNVSSDSGSRKHVTFATVNKASPASSQFSLKMDDTSSLASSLAGSISSSDSRDRNPLTFSSFTKPTGDTPPNSLQRGATASNLKGILSSPIPVSSESSSPVRPSMQNFHRPTSLALSKTVDNPSRLHSIGESQASEEPSETANQATVAGVRAQKPSLKKEAKVEVSPGKIIMDKSTPTPTSTVGVSQALPTLRDWPATSNRNKSGSTNSPKKEGVKSSSTSSGGTRTPQTARVSPTVKMDVPKLSSFRPLSSSPPNDIQDKSDISKDVKASPTNSLSSVKADHQKSVSVTVAQMCSAASPGKVAEVKAVNNKDDASRTSTKVNSDNKGTSSPRAGNVGCDMHSKPPTGPTAAKVSPRAGPARPTALVTSTSRNSTSPPKQFTSVLQQSRPSSSPTPSTGSLTNSTSTLSLASTNSSLHGSKLSLNKSTDSLTSNSSTQSVIERNRAARLAFLNSGSCQAASNGSPEPPPADPFSKYKTKNTGPSTCTGTPTPPPSNSVDERFARHKLGQRKSSTGSLSSAGSGSPTSPTCTGPTQGRFVNSMISQLATKTEGDSPTSPTTPSSGLGSSIASPQSPQRTLSNHGSPSRDNNKTKVTGVVPPSVNNNNNTISDTHKTNIALKKESCC